MWKMEMHNGNISMVSWKKHWLFGKDWHSSSSQLLHLRLKALCKSSTGSVLVPFFPKRFRTKPVKGEGQKSTMLGVQSHSWSGRELSEQQSIPESKHLLHLMRLMVLFLKLHLPYHLHRPCEFILYIKSSSYINFYGEKMFCYPSHC